MKRLNIAAGNWKMNKNYEEGVDLAKAITAHEVKDSHTMVILGTPFIHLKTAVEVAKANPNVKIAAQNCHQLTKGAYTGETSVDMIRSVGAEFVILGHSERRAYFAENNELLAQKVNTVLAADLRPIFCCGEALEIREAGTHIEFVAQQLKESLFHLDGAAFAKVVIAYEPIWAIGTGVTASPTQAQEMHNEIRQLISDKYGADIANATSILYGGSVKPANAKEIFGQQDVDGGLVGGASLKANDFIQIIDSF